MSQIAGQLDAPVGGLASFTPRSLPSGEALEHVVLAFQSAPTREVLGLAWAPFFGYNDMGPNQSSHSLSVSVVLASQPWKVEAPSHSTKTLTY